MSEEQNKVDVENKVGDETPPREMNLKDDILKEVGNYLLDFENKILKSITQNQKETKEQKTKKLNF